MKLPEQTKILTAIVGSYPKPPSVYPQSGKDLLDAFGSAFAKRREELGGAAFDALLDRAAREAIDDQNEAHIDLITDGEERRDHYVVYVISKLVGIDAKHLKTTEIRSGTVQRALRRVVNNIEYPGPMLVDEFLFAKSRAKGIAKIGLPGPCTVADCVADEYYHDKKRLAYDYAAAIHQEIEALIKAGCRVIQFDDPVLLRYPDEAKAWGLDALQQCFAGLEDRATFIVHICRGYPDKPLEAQGIAYKANQDYYRDMLRWLSESKLDVVSIEGAQGNLDLSALSAIGPKTIMLGVLDVGDERVESVRELVARGREALRHLPKDQLILAPDCGMVQLSRESAKAKLINMAKAATELNKL
jgi:5-methyltetrahydropteroyltriglutamate--homocysteine methyltransferase